jgi:hypothetical protein
LSLAFFIQAVLGASSDLAARRNSMKKIASRKI